MNKLPNDVLKNIRGYASDVYPPTPTAELIRTLRFEHREMTEENGIYFPRRLEVSAAEGHFIRAMPTTRRNYLTNDFLPSYWSEYANTMDRGHWWGDDE